MPIPALAAIGPWMANNPLWAGVISNLGYDLLQKIFPWPKSPYEQMATQQMGIGRTLIPQLQRQAAGLPTEATRAQMQQLKSESNRMRQSYGQSARAAGLVGTSQTTPARAQQGRLQAAQLQVYGSLLGQAQQSAQQQLGGLYESGIAAQREIELLKQQKKAEFLSTLGDFMKYYKTNKQDPLVQEMYEFLRNQFTMPNGAIPSTIDRSNRLPMMFYEPLSMP